MAETDPRLVAAVDGQSQDFIQYQVVEDGHIQITVNIGAVGHDLRQHLFVAQFQGIKFVFARAEEAEADAARFMHRGIEFLPVAGRHFGNRKISGQLVVQIRQYFFSQAADDAVRGQDNQAGVGEIHQRRHHEIDGVVVGEAGIGGHLLAAVHQRGGIAVVPVGHVKRLLTQCIGNAVDHGLVGNRPDLMAVAFGNGDVNDRFLLGFRFQRVGDDAVGVTVHHQHRTGVHL